MTLAETYGILEGGIPLSELYRSLPRHDYIAIRKYLSQDSPWIEVRDGMVTVSPEYRRVKGVVLDALSRDEYTVRQLSRMADIPSMQMHGLVRHLTRAGIVESNRASDTTVYWRRVQ